MAIAITKATPARRTTQRPLAEYPERRPDAMWPVESLRPLLPESFHIFENVHFVELRCTRCGWTATYSAAGVHTNTLVLDARTHARTHEEV